MKKFTLFWLILILGLIQSSNSFEIRNLGYGNKPENLQAFIYSTHSDKFIAGTTPNGHLYSFDPTNFDSLIDLGPVATPLENYALWTLCSDESGIIYGGTNAESQEHATIFRYNPLDESISKFYLNDLGIDGVIKIWSSTNTAQYVYFGASEHNLSADRVAKLIKFDKVSETAEYFMNPFTISFVRDNYPAYFDSLNKFYGGEDKYPGEAYVLSLTETENGKIYGGTYNGFIFEFDPDENTFTDNHLNIFVELNITDEVSAARYMQSSENLLFVGLPESSIKGTYAVDFSAQQPQITFLTDSVGTMIIVGNYLYVNGKKINLLDYSDITDTNFPGANISTYTFDNEPYLVRLFQRSSNAIHNIYQFDTYNINDGSITYSTIPGLEENEKNGLYRGPWICSIAATNENVYGGLCFNDAFYGHQIIYDYLENSVAFLGPAGAANVDAMIEYNNTIYTGEYPSMSIGVFNPYLNRKTNVFSFKTSSGSRQRRISCFAVDPITGLLYAGSGPSSPTSVDEENAHIVSINTGTLDTAHVLELSSTVVGLDADLKKVEDIEYYDNRLFVIGYSSIGRLMIIDVDPNNPNAPEILSGGEENYTATNILIDSANDKIYVSHSYDKLRIYVLSEVIANPIGFSEKNYVDIDLGSKIEDIIKGNEGFIYISYGNSLGRFDNSGIFIDFGQVTRGNSKAWCLTVSSNVDNKNVYIGGQDGNMYVLREDNSGPFHNDQVLTAFSLHTRLSEDGTSLGTKPIVHTGPPYPVMFAVGDFTENSFGKGDYNDEVITAFDDDLCYLSDDGLFLVPDPQDPVYSGSNTVTNFAVGDFDGDNDDEVITAFSNEECYMSDDGLDLASGSPIASGYVVTNFAVGDFDNDGDDEVITACDNGFCYFSEDGSPLIGQEVHDANSTGYIVSHFAVGDFDVDGDDDLITAFENGECHMSDTGLDLDEGDAISSGFPVKLFAVGDFDGDFDDEIVTMFDGVNSCYLSEDGQNLMAGSPVYNSQYYISHFAVGDFDGDGDDDLITAFEPHPDYITRATLSDSITDLFNATVVYFTPNSIPINGFAVGDFNGYNMLAGAVYDGNGGPLLADIPYVVAENIEIPLNQTLTVNSGATVYFSEDTRITANGLLDVTGSDLNPVFFISNDYGERGNLIARDRFTMQNGGILALSSHIDIDIIEEPGDDKIDYMNISLPGEFAPDISLQPKNNEKETKEIKTPALDDNSKGKKKK
jgi:hypothetical protein